MSDERLLKQSDVKPWQQALVNQLIEQHQNSRLPHGLILHTDQNSDLSGFLWHLAMNLLCEDTDSINHCGQCNACQLMLANNFPDVIWLSKLYDEKKKKFKRDITVDQIRELIHQLSLTNQYDSLKIAIIYPAEALNKNAANSLLKTLEEPESDTLLILVTHKLGRLPVTIRSRCQQYKIPQANKVESMKWCGEQGVDEATINAMLLQGITDPVTIVEFNQHDYLEMQQQCELKMLSYMAKNSPQELQELTADLMAMPLPMMRLVINGFIEKLIRFHVDAFSYAEFFRVFKTPQKSYARDLYKIKNTIQLQMLFEENNLNVQLQINDVLISLKSVFK